jgi:methyl-accepting chemotaxis protein
MSKTPRRRRSLLVPGSSQRHWFLVITPILLALLLVSGVLFYVFAQRRLEEEYFKAHSQIRSVMEMLLPWMVGVYLAGLAAASGLTLLLSRRLAGPLVAIRRQLAAAREGDLEARVTLRRGDEYAELAAEINALLEAQGRRLQEAERRLAEREGRA